MARNAEFYKGSKKKGQNDKSNIMPYNSRRHTVTHSFLLHRSSVEDQHFDKKEKNKAENNRWTNKIIR